MNEYEKDAIASVILIFVGFVAICLMIALAPFVFLVIAGLSISIPATVWALNRVLR